MKTELVWSERIHGRENFKGTVFDIAFKPDGTQVIVAVGNRILVYDASEGEIVHSLKGHKDYVYCVTYSRDGKRFATGAADKTVIIWTTKCEGILKYSHNDSVQSLAYNPVTQQLASCTGSDFGLWSPENKSVPKFKTGKVLCCSWTNDGQFIALGQFNGQVSVRDKSGNEKLRINRGNCPVWTLQWSPTPDEVGELLAIGSWDQKLAFYRLTGQIQGKERDLGFDPCSLSYYANGEYIVIGGTDKKVSMYTRDGTFLKTIVEREDWVWAVAARPKQKYLAVGSNDGTIAMVQTVFNTVHGLYQDRYAHRDSMLTDVIIQHLITDRKVRIKTRDYVKKIAVYKARLAVQLPDRVLIYETNPEDPNDMHYRLKEKIVKKLDCNLLVVTSEHIILCQEKRLQLYDFKGTKIREWILEAVIRYIRVAGGPQRREGLLVGLKNGAVFKIFVDNRFPVKLISHSVAVRCLDLSASRQKLAVVDENSRVFVYDLNTKEVIFEESSNNANSVAWNSEFEDMFCYSGNGQLSIKTGDFPIHRQSLQGFVVGFRGSKIFCLHYLAMQTIDVPQSASLMRYLDTRDFNQAYRVACLGVTDADWRELALRALSNLNFDIARKAFIRLRDVRYLELLNRIEIARRNPKHDDNVFQADILAFQGNYDDAVRIYCKIGQRRRAIELFLDLRDWNRAKELVEQLGGSEEELKQSDGDGFSMADLLKRQAEWLVEAGETAQAAEMFWLSKDYEASIKLMGDNAWSDLLIQKARLLSKLERKSLALAANYFTKAGNHQYAKEIYLKMDDIKSLMKLHVELHRWDEAFELMKERPEFAKDSYYVAYAEWLAINDRFDEAQAAFAKGGKPERAFEMLEQLTHNAVLENRYNDAGYYYWRLAQENLKLVATSDPNKPAVGDREKVAKFKQFQRKAELYYAYHSIYRFNDEAFTRIKGDVMFHTAQFLLNSTLTDSPFGISKVYSLHTLARQGQEMEAFKLARLAYQKLLTLRVSSIWREQIDHAALCIRTKPYTDKEELLPMCYLCSTQNPLLNNQGEKCTNCGSLFIRSFLTFEPLPLVEFILEGVTDEEAKSLIAQDPTSNATVKKEKGDKGKSDKGKASSRNVQTMSLGEDEEDIKEDDQLAVAEDGFQQQLIHLEANFDGTYPPIRVDKKTLANMPSEEIFIRHFPSTLMPYRYYRSIFPQLPIVMCSTCQNFFHEEGWEAHVLQNKSCPFCRTPQVIEGIVVVDSKDVIKTAYD